MDDVYAYLVKLPSNIPEAVTKCSDGYTVYLNENMTHERQMEAYLHALGHIRNMDFDKMNVQEIESDAHA